MDAEVRGESCAQEETEEGEITMPNKPILRGAGRCGPGKIWDAEARACISLAAYQRKYGKTRMAQLDYSKTSPELTKRRRNIG